MCSREERAGVAGIGGYVLAGGQSRRMGRDKALLLLEGKPLVEHATAKLEKVCSEVAILSARPELAPFGRLVPDVHAGCGPLGGMEAALLETRFAWNLFLPVDVPFLPVRSLLAWFDFLGTKAAPGGARVLLPTVDGQPQPTLALVHRDTLPWLTRALEAGEYKLMPVLAAAAAALAADKGFVAEAGLWRLPYWSTRAAATEQPPGREFLEQEAAAMHDDCARWFLNLNTPDEFAAAAGGAGVPDV